MKLSLSGGQIVATVAVSVAASIYIIKKYCAGGVCRSQASLKGKVVVITGANSGIGLEAARDFAKRGGRVILACRNQSRGQAAIEEIRQTTGNNDVVYMHLDLASFKSIHEFTEQIIRGEKTIDILVNNAGSLAWDRQLTEDGLELMMGVNHFGPFLLTNLLLDKIKKSTTSRIVNVSSMAHTFIKSIHLDDIQSEKNFNSFKVYCQSKLANVLFTRSLAKKLKDSNVTVNTLHPGVVNTELWKDLWILNYTLGRWIFNGLAYIFLKSSVQGAQTTIYLAVSEDVEGITGHYFVDCRPVKLKEHAVDEEAGNRLWDISEQLTGLK